MPFTLNLSFLQKLLFSLFVSMFTHLCESCFVCLLFCEYLLSGLKIFSPSILLNLSSLSDCTFYCGAEFLSVCPYVCLTFLIIFIHSYLVIFIKEAISSQSLGFRFPIFGRAGHRPALHHLTPLSSPLPQLKPLPFCL